MKFENQLIEATLLRRYKRFLADIELANGDIVVAHVANTGSMKTCWEPGWKVYLSESSNPKRKLKYSVELIHNGHTYISVNTSATNKIVKQALEKKIIPELADYDLIKPEATIFDSRLDFLLTKENKKTYIEVKNVTLLGENGTALFPDSVTTRGQKHLRDLIKIKEESHRAVMLFIINREDVHSFSPAAQIDPTYAKLLKEASQKGVEIIAYQTKISKREIILSKKITCFL